jgi:hypothetical protein
MRMLKVFLCEMHLNRHVKNVHNNVFWHDQNWSFYTFKANNPIFFSLEASAESPPFLSFFKIIYQYFCFLTDIDADMACAILGVSTVEMTFEIMRLRRIERAEFYMMLCLPLLQLKWPIMFMANKNRSVFNPHVSMC